MRQKLGGMDLDLVSGAELETAMRGLKEWMVEVARGIRPILFNAQGTADATGLVQIGGANTLTGGRMGPDNGFAWAVSRVSVRVDGVPAPFTLYTGGPHVNSIIRDVNADANGYAGFGAQECLLIGGDQLYLRTQSTTPSTGLCTLSGAAIEIPNQLMWKWLAG